MAKKGRNSSEEERQLWEKVTRTVKAYSPAKKNLPKKPEVQEKKILPPPAPTFPSASATKEPKGFDRATETKLRKGQLPLEGRLDLHGMAQEEAFGALHRFIQAAVHSEKRTLLVITGKGQRSEGVLKRLLPLWLEEPSLKKNILALIGAAPKDGGSGAFYIRLRKRRTN